MHVITAPASDSVPASSAKPPSTAQANPPRLHLDYLDGLRAFAALIVVAGHCACLYFPFVANQVPTSLNWALFAGMRHAAHFSVDTFIVLSGFCLMLPVVRAGGVLRGGVVEFFKRRARRILPPYYAALGLSVLMIVLTLVGRHTPLGAFPALSLEVSRRALLAHLLLLQDTNAPLITIDPPLWSVSVEWQIYFLFPLLVLGWRRIGGPLTTAAALAFALLGVVCVHLVPQHGLNLWAFAIQYVALFAFGMMAADVAFSARANMAALRSRVPWGPVAGGVAALVCLLCSRHTFDWVSERYGFVDFAVGLCASALLVVMARAERNLAQHICSWRPLAVLGTFSYSLYLIHFPILIAVYKYAQPLLHLSARKAFAPLTLLAFVVVTACAYGFFLLVERPFLNARARETRAEGVGKAVPVPAH